MYVMEIDRGSFLVDANLGRGGQTTTASPVSGNRLAVNSQVTLQIYAGDSMEKEVT